MLRSAALSFALLSLIVVAGHAAIVTAPTSPSYAVFANPLGVDGAVQVDVDFFTIVSPVLTVEVTSGDIGLGTSLTFNSAIGNDSGIRWEEFDIAISGASFDTSVIGTVTPVSGGVTPLGEIDDVDVFASST